ncbi:hypothetical protein EPA93_15575 [Ktedonosporobacter rubrisoli]|uniref:Uncharacterized protein n=1 Tax=Ktedonosporobacter rubrisoli TaxID=2509675 RepID=A0A4P6JPY4_KTERU|nr:hypothetical protein [Ktedonosporobacter rubrisoli]QBD77334.1 hypothetical protein EPA93_15575 [Ktedonosporobacter rubrisoli]
MELPIPISKHCFLAFRSWRPDPWRKQRQDCWDSPPESIRESVRDYLLQQLHCKVRRYGMYEMVRLSVQSPSTVRTTSSSRLS